MEKMGYVETHFIDVRHELTKKINEKIEHVDEQLTNMKSDYETYTDERFDSLNYGEA